MIKIEYIRCMMEYVHAGYRGMWSLRLCSRLCSVISVICVLLMLYSTSHYHRKNVLEYQYPKNWTLQSMWGDVVTLLLNAEPNTNIANSNEVTEQATTPLTFNTKSENCLKRSQSHGIEATTVAIGKESVKKVSQNSTLGEQIQQNHVTVTHHRLPPPRRYLCPFEGGRMGNMLFNYASTYCLTRRVNKKLIIPKKYKLLKYFNLTPRPVPEIPYLGICSTTKNRNLRRVRVKVAGKYMNISMPEDNDVILYGYLQSWRYFNECRDDIRQQLSFKDKNLYKKADDRIKHSVGMLNNKLQQTHVNHTVVGIHVRRGDFRKYSPVGSKSYFKKARDFYRRLHENVVFVIITDSSNESRSWCSENIVRGSNDTLLLDVADVITDLATMWSCDHSIISVGTFSWWTAWMNYKNGKVVYYLGERWRNKNGDFVLPNWIGMTD